ncbi:MAG TPA: SEC-C metal-binding domain-containing protein [Burkholderiaceae bacterium]|nr:SEC-C metal-binding domain-containing protein [Burkholderiaceae bacterium]
MRDKIGRNDPCPGGSGKKYKHCHLPADEARSTAPPSEEERGFRRALETWANQQLTPPVPPQRVDAAGGEALPPITHQPGVMR